MTPRLPLKRGGKEEQPLIFMTMSLLNQLESSVIYYIVIWIFINILEFELNYYNSQKLTSKLFRWLE